MTAVPTDSPAPGTPGALKALADAWADVAAAERANAQLYITELCDALGVPRPRGAGSGYQFEFAIKIGARDGTESQGYVDCYKAGHFVLEAKDAEAGASDAALRRAYGQARMYALNDPTGTAPPYLLVLDVGKTLVVWHRWGGTYQGYQAGHRIDLPTLHTRPADLALLRDIWLEPTKRDPRQHAQAVTAEIATKLATLAAALEDRGFEQERVARFLMRVVFSCFAEDVDLLPRDAFRQTVERAGVAGSPERFAQALESLWQAMDTGGMFGYESLLRFNGHFFQAAEALPLARDEIALLLEAAKADWKDVEPTIFGTLLTRALDPAERHRLGAEYTPRAFIERIVRPTVEEPVRERWTAVQAEVLQLTGTGKPRDRAAAEQRVREFLDWLRGLKVLDPACGSGNFLYVTMHLLKEVEYEAVRELEAVTGHPELRMQEIGPQNFLGIEVKPWAREIAELTLWIGFHQFWKRHHAVQPPEPVLKETGTLELRDAVLAWDEVRHVPEKDRPDPTPRLVHPVTGELVPDPEARLRYLEHVNARPAEWPEADFIVGNPPFLGGKRVRAALGDGYADALQDSRPELPDAADLVMYWWDQAARLVAEGRVIRAGLITTNSLRQTHNRPVVDRALARGATISWAVADHPWSDDVDGAAVRISMTVLARDVTRPAIGIVDMDGALRSRPVSRINADLSTHANVAAAAQIPLRSNAGLCYFGFLVNGSGFLLSREERDRLLALDSRNAEIIRLIVGGRDIAQRPEECFVIDFAERTLDEARAYPHLYGIVVDRVKPGRDANRDRGIRENWWRFHRIRQELRRATVGLSRFIVTVETMKHRVFTMLDVATAPDHSLVCIASDDPFILGVLSSRVHVAWALAAGATLEDRPRYTRTATFDPFPFPGTDGSARDRIGAAATAIDEHRKQALRAHDSVTITAMYNVLEKLRRGERLTVKERLIHEVAACTRLLEMHEALDAQVAHAYDIPWPAPDGMILEHLVRLHETRVQEERRGEVKWLRPDFQSVRYGTDGPGHIMGPAMLPPSMSADPSPLSWPSDAIGQITVLRTMMAMTPLSAEEAVSRLSGAKRELVHRHLETLALLGEVRDVGDGRYVMAVDAV